ncbi:MAG: sugar phosphate isomerase/epimerase [Planctomycetes bacterium]|nr:sugar phosphate isomerase/epimerase [Planctomycetota bacterium]
MFGTKIAIQTAGLGQPLTSAVQTAASLGADAIEIDARSELRPKELSQTAVRQLRKLLSDANLRVAAIAFHTRRGYDALEELDRRVDATRDAMQMAAQLGAPVVVNRVGTVPEDQQSRGWMSLVEVLTDLGRTGERLGVRLAAQTGAESGPRLATLLGALPESTIAVTFDPAALLLGGFSIEEALAALGPSVGHVYATDAKRDSAGRVVETPMGRGAVDYPALLGGLQEYDYRGALSLGCRGASHPAAALQEALAALRQM